MIWNVIFLPRQVETKSGMINTLEHQLDESKKRTSHQFDVIQKLEDQVRELNVELASVQSQADKQQQNVSQTIFVWYCSIKSFTVKPVLCSHLY